MTLARPETGIPHGRRAHFALQFLAVLLTLRRKSHQELISSLDANLVCSDLGQQALSDVVFIVLIFTLAFSSMQLVLGGFFFFF